MFVFWEGVRIPGRILSCFRCRAFVVVISAIRQRVRKQPLMAPHIAVKMGTVRPTITSLFYARVSSAGLKEVGGSIVKPERSKMRWNIL